MTTYSRKTLEKALPDYLVGAANQDLVAAIESLARTDEAFANLLARERRVFDAMKQPREFELDRAAEHDFTRLKARIRSEEASAAASRGNWLSWVLRPAPALAAVMVAAIVMVTMLPVEDEGFRTLSDTTTTSAGDVRVIFESLPSEAQIENFEARYSLQYQSGPDTAGSYIFSTDGQGTTPELLEALRRDPALTFVGRGE